MSRLSVFGLAILVGVVLSCGEDKPTEPVRDLVGSWTYRGTDFGQAVL